jgi:hypothetical protein
VVVGVAQELGSNGTIRDNLFFLLLIKLLLLIKFLKFLKLILKLLFKLLFKLGGCSCRRGG